MSNEVKSNGQDNPETKNPDLASVTKSTSENSLSATTTESNAQSSATTTSTTSANNHQSSSANNSNGGSKVEVASSASTVKSEKSDVEVKTEPSSNTSTAPAKVERPPPRNEPRVEPVNGIVHPPVVPPASRPGRVTNQILYLKNNVVKGTRLGNLLAC